MDLALPPISLALSGCNPVDLGVANVPRAARPGVPADVAAGGAMVRELLSIAASFGPAGLRSVQLDAALPGIRPRDLDRSGRRDLMATARRTGLSFSGLDLFIPPEHFLKADTLDRATSSTIAALELAAELRIPGDSGVALSVNFPGSLATDVLSTLTSKAQHLGVRIADCGWPIADRAESQSMSVGIDPASILASGEDPVSMIGKLGPRLAAARLSDCASGIGAVRVAPGSPSGRLDLAAYLVSLSAVEFTGSVALDLRGVADQRRAIGIALKAAKSVGLAPGTH